MGIVDRIGRVVKANLNALLENAEDPDKVIAQTLREMDDGIRKAKQDLVSTTAGAKRLEQEIAQHHTEAERWEERAGLALRQGDEPLARQALAQKIAENKLVEQAQLAAGQHRAAATELERAVESLGERRRELDANKALLAGQVRAARRADSATPATARLSELDRMGARIDAMEAEVEASSVISDPKKADLEAKFAALESHAEDGAIEDELAELKKRLS